MTITYVSEEEFDATVQRMEARLADLPCDTAELGRLARFAAARGH